MTADKEIEAVVSSDDEGPSYASLTAGLLARKGEALPAAAAFTTESVAQQIPAQKLAQESARLGGANAKVGLEDDCGLTASSIEPPGTIYEESEMASELIEDDNEPTSGSPKSGAPEPGSPESGSMEERSAFIKQALADQGRIHDDTSEQPLLSAGILGGSLDDDDTDVESTGRSLAERDAVVSPDHGFASRLVAASVDRAKDLLGRDDATSGSGSDKAAKSSCATTKAIAADRIKSAYTASAVGGTALHLDPRRFIRLQIAAMKLEVDRKELLSAALDAYLDALDEEVFAECSCMRKGLI